MLLAVLRHIDAHHRRLIIEEEFRQGLRKLRLTHASRAQEQEGTNRTVRIRNARTRTPHRIRHGHDRFPLAHNAASQDCLHVQQLLGLTLHHLARRDARPRRHNLSNHLRRNLLREHRP